MLTDQEGHTLLRERQRHSSDKQIQSIFLDLSTLCFLTHVIFAYVRYDLEKQKIWEPGLGFERDQSLGLESRRQRVQDWGAQGWLQAALKFWKRTHFLQPVTGYLQGEMVRKITPLLKGDSECSFRLITSGSVVLCILVMEGCDWLKDWKMISLPMSFQNFRDCQQATIEKRMRIKSLVEQYLQSNLATLVYYESLLWLGQLQDHFHISYSLSSPT